MYIQYIHGSPEILMRRRKRRRPPGSPGWAHVKPDRTSGILQGLPLKLGVWSGHFASVPTTSP